MAFKVFPESLDGYARQLERAAGDARDAKRYMGQYADFHRADGPLIKLAGDGHKAAVGALTTAMSRAASMLETSSRELAGAASYYRATDATAAARADGTVTSVCAREGTLLAKDWAQNPCQPSFGDSREPARRLKPVEEVEYSHPLAWMDALSVSNWALEAVDVVFGFNPLNEVLEFFSGDWQSLAKAGVAIGRVGDAMYDLAYNVHGGVIALGSSWDGSAADAAHAYFVGLANGVAGLRDPIKEISHQYDRLAHGVWSASEAASGFIKGLLDNAIIAGIAIAAGTITAETGIGAVVGYGVAALEVANMLRLWGQATAAMQGIYGSVQAALGFIEVEVAKLSEAKLPVLPGAGYDHPLVKA